MLLIAKYQVVVNQLLKHSVIHTNNVLRRRLRMFAKRYHMLVGWSKRLITTQKLHRQKTKYVMLLDIILLLSIPNSPRLNIKQLISLIQLIKQLLIKKTAEIESKIRDITNLGTKAPLNIKAKESENERSDTTSFITSQELNRLTIARMKEAVKGLLKWNMMSQELPLKALTSGTYRGPSGKLMI